MNGDSGFIFDFPREHLKSALVVSLLSVWVLVGLFYYLNRYTRRRYFSIWTAAWLFYAVWLTLCIGMQKLPESPFLLMLKQWCVGTSAVFLLWGGIDFLKLPARQRLFALFLGFLFVWSYIGAYHLDDPLAIQLPIFGLIGLSSGIAAWSFFRLRRSSHLIGAGLLSIGFLLWGIYLVSYPFLETREHLISAGFFISAVLQLFIAVSMIVLVLEEARQTELQVTAQIRSRESETERLKLRVASTEERYRSLFDQASEAIIITAAEDLQIIELNQTARRMLGLNGSDQGHGCLSSYCPREGSMPPKDGSEWFQWISEKRQIRVVRRDGGSTLTEVDAAPIQFEGRSAYQFFFREQTERARLEQQLRQAEKLSALGQMISGVAHELNNPLAVIKGYLELVLSRHELAPHTRADLEKVAHESNRAAKLVSNFLSFAREQPVQRQPTNINELIARVLELRTFDLRIAGVTVVTNFVSQLPLTQVDPDQIQQVLMNLINNAAQAMVENEKPGKLTITTRIRGELIQVLVEDTGPGVPDHVLPHIFEPFFTTKEVGTGTGLGLSIAHSIMSDHLGKLFYQPSTEGGACFGLEFPVLTAAASQDAGHAPALATEHTPAASCAGGRILILDDERSIAEMLGEMLALLNYAPTICWSAPRALELLEQTEFDLVLSDFRMPVMDGQEFYEIAVVKRPALARRIIFLTGDVVNEETRSFLQKTGNPHLSKPFQLSSVERLVAEVLRREGLRGTG